MKQARVVVFDLDDTLVDTYKTEWHRVSAAYHALSGVNLPESKFQSIYGKPGFAFHVSRIIGDINVDKFIAAYDAMKNKVPYQTHVRGEDLNELHKCGYIIGYVTNSRSKKCIEKLNAIEFVAWDFRYTIDDLDMPKPYTNILTTICKRFRALPEECIIIGDSEIDKSFAQQNNATFLPVNTGRCQWHNQDRVFSEVKEAISYLIQEGKKECGIWC